ncbi:hypothetical protein [Anaeroselena agilis]|uniref:HMA domain-containing protein n=1 Tax=Anaeroselena agilis TaxID=3063788 RepID=A0ABU3NVP5_9FIRM|nr:hypothetical protein [Selenomonadales bacterium 4137-cl]
MCKECGCPAHGSSQVKFFVKGIGENARDAEKSLRGMPGVYFISINNIDGLTTVFYAPSRTTFNDIKIKLAEHGIEALA